MINIFFDHLFSKYFQIWKKISKLYDNKSVLKQIIKIKQIKIYSYLKFLEVLKELNILKINLNKEIYI